MLVGHSLAKLLGQSCRAQEGELSLVWQAELLEVGAEV